jgi:CDP-diacylglycerol--glycerol-3-phosphate 3-phosphatidyltransferase
MPTIYDLKPRFQQLLHPLAYRLYRLGITANMVTLTAAFASLAYGAWMLLETTRRLPFLFLPLFMLTRMALNAIDGMLARQYQQQSKLGAILNEAGDVVSDVAIYMPFALLPGTSTGLVVVVVFLSVLTEFVGVLGQTIGGGRRYDGPMGKSDRAFLFGGLGLLLGLELPVLPYLNAGFSIVAILLCWTVLNRSRQALRSSEP